MTDTGHMLHWSSFETPLLWRVDSKLREGKALIDDFFAKPLVKRQFNAAVNIAGDLRGFATNIPKFLDMTGIYASSGGIEGKCFSVFGDFGTFLKGLDCSHRAVSFFYNIFLGKDKDDWSDISLVEPLDALGNIPIALGSLTRGLLGIPERIIQIVNAFSPLAPAVLSFGESISSFLGIVSIICWVGYLLRSVVRAVEVYYVIWHLQKIDPKFMGKLTNWYVSGLNDAEAQRFCETLRDQMREYPRFAKSIQRLTGARDELAQIGPMRNPRVLVDNLAHALNKRRVDETKELILFLFATFISIAAIVFTGGAMPVVVIGLGLILTTLFFVLNNVRDYSMSIGEKDKRGKYDKHFLFALSGVLITAMAVAAVAIALSFSTGGIFPIVMVFVAAGIITVLQLGMVFRKLR